MKLSKFKQDVTSAEEGQWVDLGDDCKVKVRRIGCKAYNDYIKQVLKPYTNSKQTKTIPESVWEDATVKGMADIILVDWEGLLDDADKPIKFSHDKAYEILKDPAYKDFADLVGSLANEAETFRAVEVSETVSKSR